MELLGIVQTIIGGIGSGSIYALIGLCFVLIFGLMEVCSVVHGDLMIFGGYIAFWSLNLWGIDPFLSLLYIFPLLIVIGYVIQRFLLKPFMAMEIWKGRFTAQVMRGKRS